MTVAPPVRAARRFVTAARGERALSYSFAASGVIQLMNVLTGILLARTLGPEGRGAVAAVILWPSVLVAVGSLGLFEAVTYRAARSRSSEDLGRLTGTAFALGGAQAFILVAVGVFALPHLLSAYGGNIVSTGILFLAFVPLNFTAVYAMSMLNGRGRARAFHWLRVLVVGVSTIGIVLLGAVGLLDVRSVAIVYLIANLVTLLSSLFALRAAGLRRLGVERAISRRLLSFGIRSHAGSVATFLNERLDQLVIAAFLAPRSLGLYVVAVTLTAPIGLVGSSISFVALPSVAASEDAHTAARVARRYVGMSVGLSVGIAVPLIVITPFLVDVFFGPSFVGSTTPARILLVAGTVLSTGRVLSAVLRGLNRPSDAGIGEASALVVTGLALPILLPSFGLSGAAVASLLAYSVSMLWLAVRLSRALSTRRELTSESGRLEAGR